MKLVKNKIVFFLYMKQIITKDNNCEQLAMVGGGLAEKSWKLYLYEFTAQNGANCEKLLE
mgnify:CR=1 FL=1